MRLHRMLIEKSGGKFIEGTDAEGIYRGFTRFRVLPLARVDRDKRCELTQAGKETETDVPIFPVCPDPTRFTVLTIVIIDDNNYCTV